MLGHSSANLSVVRHRSKAVHRYGLHVTDWHHEPNARTAISLEPGTS